MIIASENRNVQVVGAVESKVAGIRANRAMLMLLSKQYSDYPWAIVREYGTNMIDGYAELRRVRPGAEFIPPVIKLPTPLFPYIEFTDYGIGMDYDRLWNVFTDYGASTKGDTNEQVGGFGIGAKVANYYEKADVWFVESRYDGMKHILHVTRNADGLPEYHRMPSIPTDEPNGVTVRIPIPQSEWQYFHDAAKRLAMFFPMELRLLADGQEVEYEKRTYILQGTGWGIRQGRGDNTVIVGNVPYPLDVSILCYRTGLDGDLFNYLSLDFAIPVGEVEIAPNREMLIYEDLTINRLKKAVEVFLSELGDLASKQIEDQPTAWEAARVVMEEWRNSGLRRVVGGATWRGIPIDPHLGIGFLMSDIAAQFPEGTKFHFAEIGRNGSRNGSVRISPWNPDTVWISKHHARLNAQGKPEREHYVSPVHNNWIILDDLLKGGHARVRYFLQEQLTYLDYRNRRRAQSSGWALVISGEGLDRDTVSKVFFGMPVLLTSELPEPPAIVRTRQKAKLQRLDPYSTYWSKEEEVNLDEGGFYVRLARSEIIDGDGAFSPYSLDQLRQAAVQIGIFSKAPVIYGIPRTRQNVEKMDGWINFVDYVKEKVTKLLAHNAQGMANDAIWLRVEQHPVGHVLWFVGAELPKGSLGHQIREGIRMAREKRERYQQLRNMASCLRLETKAKEPDKTPMQLLKEAKQRYPMLCLTDLHRNAFTTNEKIAMIVEYVNLMDKLAKEDIASAA